MPEILFSPEADELLTRFESDPRAARLAARLNSALDRLEADPGDYRNRRRRFHTLDLWGISVMSDDEEWLILWEPPDDETVIVHHIVPAP